MLGLKGWPASAEAGAVARAIAILADVVRDVPAARLHLTHVSTAAALAHVRAAKAAGLPVTCDVTPHHLALTDEWIAGLRRWSWDALDDDGRRAIPGRTARSRPRRSTRRCASTRRSARRWTQPRCLAALVDGTADAIATDHAPHTEVDKHVEFGWAANGISGIETAIGLVLAAVDAERLPLGRAIEALTTGPARGASSARRSSRACARASPRTSSSSTAAPRGGPFGRAPLEGQELAVAWPPACRGVVRLTLAGGRVAYAAD